MSILKIDLKYNKYLLKSTMILCIHGAFCITNEIFNKQTYCMSKTILKLTLIRQPSSNNMQMDALH